MLFNLSPQVQMLFSGHPEGTQGHIKKWTAQAFASSSVNREMRCPLRQVLVKILQI